MSKDDKRCLKTLIRIRDGKSIPDIGSLVRCEKRSFVATEGCCIIITSKRKDWMKARTKS